jgi:diacylglycerol kinase family enzyme
VRIEATPPQPVELDGDVLGATPLSASVVPGAISIIVPR